MGMVNHTPLKATPLSNLQTLALMLQELALYLDTHKDDRQALQMYQSYQKMYHECMMRYSEKCGPMNHRTPSEGEYRWLDDPWPWEYCANKEA